MPDVRDGLKPVQRRILYTMWQQNLTADAKHRKCAKVVGDVMGNYHPHGDSAIYETLVRMAQSFSLRYPLIDGSGNFGSLDGDGAAAMRYTECRLARLADEVLQEIEQETVAFRPSYDGTKSEPIVLPSRVPNLLVNGSTGIAVGMATNIPPHNLNEICTALDQAARQSRSHDAAVVPVGEGPRLSDRRPHPEFARRTEGDLPDRDRDRFACARPGKPVRASRSGKKLYITSIPYAVNKAQLVEQIGDVVLSRKMPHLIDVRDVSTDDVRIELELKAGADDNLVMAYLFKNTSLQTTFAVNMTCLVPTENAGSRPARSGSISSRCCGTSSISAWRSSPAGSSTSSSSSRSASTSSKASRRSSTRSTRSSRSSAKSDGKADSAEKIMKRFSLDAEQTDAILELKLYRLARLEILVIQQELGREAQARPADRHAAEGRRGPLEARARRARGDPGQVRQLRRSIRAARASRKPKKSNTPPNPSSSRKTTS